MTFLFLRYHKVITNSPYLFQIGCFDKFGELAGDHLEIIIPVIIGVLVIQVIIIPLIIFQCNK